MDSITSVFKILMRTLTLISCIVTTWLYVVDLSLLKRRLTHDVVQFLKWGMHFQAFSPHNLAGVYYFRVADLFSYPWLMPAAPQLWDRCNTLWIASWYAWRNVNSAFIWYLFKVELVLYTTNFATRKNHIIIIWFLYKNYYIILVKKGSRVWII